MYKMIILFPKYSLDEKFQKTIVAIFGCKNTLGRAVYINFTNNFVQFCKFYVS